MRHGGTSCRPFMFFKNALYVVKACRVQLNFPLLECNKNKLYKALDYCSCDMLKFNF